MLRTPRQTLSCVRVACAPADPHDVHRPLAAHENVEAEMVWREERTVTASLALHFNKAMFILEPTPLTRSLARKRVHVCEYPDGRIEIRHGERVLPYRVFDKMRQVNQAAIVDNKQLGAALAMAQAIQVAAPHHPKRNNNETAHCAWRHRRGERHWLRRWTRCQPVASP